MKKGNIERIERTSYLLEMGIDFQANDLEVIASNGINELRGLNKEYRTKTLYEIAFKNNMGKHVWDGHFDKSTQTVKVIFEKELFVEV